MDPTYEETMKRRAERRRKRRIQQQRRTAALTAASFALGLTVGGLAFGRKPAPTITVIEPQADHASANDWTGKIQVNSLEAAAEQESENPCYILDNGLNPSIQAQIFRACREDKDLYAAVMAIAQIESRMDPAAVGDDGKSIGIMQINTAAQKDRIKALGITDLKDPVQSVKVAVDYIDWLAAQIQSDSSYPYTDHALYMAYNMGLQGSRTAIAGGTTSTEYSTAAMAMYYSNLAEMGGWTN